MYILPFKPAKNQALTIYLSDVYSGVFFQDNGTDATIKISKDGGAFAIYTGTYSFVGSGGASVATINLSADDMNGNTIMVMFQGSISGREAFVIYTDGYTAWPDASGGGGATAQEIVDTLMATVVNDDRNLPAVMPTIGEIFALLSQRILRNKHKKI